MGVGILISSYTHGHFKVCLKFHGGGNFDIILPLCTSPVNLKFHGGGNFDITLPFCTFPVNLKFPGGPNIEITLPLWTHRVNGNLMGAGIGSTFLWGCFFVFFSFFFQSGVLHFGAKMCHLHRSSAFPWF